MAAYALTLDDFEADYSAEIWPDTSASIEAFIAMSTQWRIGMSGRTGLDYGVLPQVMRLCGIKRSEWPVVFEDVRTMEYAALDEMSKH